MRLTGQQIVVEEYLDGEEVSFFALIDGNTCVALTSAQDHKAVGEGDTGPNTGGMGAYSPAPVLTSKLHAQVRTLRMCCRSVCTISTPQKDNAVT